MENEFPFLDMSHFTHSEQLNNMMPMITGVARPLQQPAAVRNNSSELYQQPNFHPRPSQPVLHSVSALPPSKIGKRQTNRQKYTDEDVQKICRMKESGMSWRFASLIAARLTGSKIAAEFPGRSQKSLQVSYCVNFKKRAEKFQDADV